MEPKVKEIKGKNSKDKITSGQVERTKDQSSRKMKWAVREKDEMMKPNKKKGNRYDRERRAPELLRS